MHGSCIHKSKKKNIYLFNADNVATEKFDEHHVVIDANCATAIDSLSQNVSRLM
jgi:hypothetical protein